MVRCFVMKDKTKRIVIWVVVIALIAALVISTTYYIVQPIKARDNIVETMNGLDNS